MKENREMGCKMSKDDLGDRMKLFESVESDRRFLPTLPVLARLDGKAFHNFCGQLKKPYDERLSNLMVFCTQKLVQETNANCGYTQSDEISLAWYASDYRSSIFFDGRISKMTSILAAMQSVYFNQNLEKYIPDYQVKNTPLFDCRVWMVPSIEEAANCFLWREQDATKNAISMAARAYFSHNELQDKNGKEMQEMLWKKGVNFNDYPAFFKRGTFVQRKKTLRPFTAEEIESLPPKHNARKGGQGELFFERTGYEVLNLPPFIKIKNRSGVLFFGEDVILEKDMVDSF